MRQIQIDHAAIDKIVNATTAAEAWVHLRKTLRNAGFDNLLYGTNRLRKAGVFGKRADSFFLSDLPAGLMQKFWDEELYRTAPVAIWAMQNQGPMSLDYGSERYHAGELPKDQRQTQEILMEAGITSGYVVGFNPPQTTVATAVALLNMGRTQEETDENWARNGKTILTYASIFNLRMASLPLPSQKSGLTERQKEVLHWVAHGKTSAEVATILGLSTATIEKHLRQARDTLGASTTTQAVLFAQINEHIFTSRLEQELEPT